jgi:OmcA/MtrC family decaheme c-type cytochrome
LFSLNCNFENEEKKMKSTLVRLGLLALTLFALAGCGGGGSDGVPGTAGTPGTPGTPGSGSTVGTNSVTPTADATAAWKALAPQVTITGVTIASPPVVKFTVKDADGKAVLGLGNKSQSATATVAGLTNLGFTLAKLVPGVGNAPSKWVSYNVVNPPTVAQKAGTIATTASCNADKTWCGTFPTTDTQGTLVDNGDGSYQYTFYRDPKQAAAIVAGLTDSVDGLAKKADLGDLSFDPTLTHRVGIQLGGAAPGTGSNTPNGVTVIPGVNMVNTGNAVYDFRPDGGTLNNTRNVVKFDSCSDCHQGKVLAHGSRKDPNYCVTCHTDQIKYTFSQEASSTNGGMTLTGTTRPTTAVVDGRALGNFPNMVHKIHMGAELLKQGYNFNAAAEGKFNEFKFPQDQRNCTKCHDGSATAVNKTANGDNWKSVPSRLACGSCHDGINFATGQGTSLAGTAFSHLPGGQADDFACSSCHTAATIPVYHIPVTPPNTASALHVNGGNANSNAAAIASNTNNLPAGAIKITYDIKSVARNSAKQPVMVFRMLQNGAAVAFNDKAAKTEIWDGFMGAPSVYFVYALPQDGITAPADFNASASGYLRSLWNGKATGTGAGTLTGPDATGYYTATLTGVIIPDNAVMLTGGLGYSYNNLTTLPLTQTNLPKYPVTPASATTGLTAGMVNMIGGLIVITPDAQKVATGYNARRVIVEDARCNKCHQELGVFTAESFHAGQRNDGTTCSWCHNPNRTSSGWGADSTNFIHGIHGGSKRTVKFNWHAVSATDGFWDIGYPGVLKNCEACHVPGSYDFSATASAGAVPNRLYRTVATGTLAAGISVSPYVTVGKDYGAGYSVNAATGVATAAAGTTLVDSPITTACFACHDSDLAKVHMISNGGSIYEARSTALAKPEQCLICHGTGRVADIKTMHAK